MALFQSQSAKGRKFVQAPWDGLVTTVPIEVRLTPAALAAGDIIELQNILPATKVVGLELAAPEMDTGAGLAVTFGALNSDVTDIADTYEAGLALGQGATITATETTVCLFADDTVERNLGLKVTAVAATAVTGEVTFYALLRIMG